MFRKKIATLILITAMLAVLLRALIPAGYMPDLQTGKAFQLVICAADGPHQVTADEKYNPFAHPFTDAPVKKTDVKSCDFALNIVHLTPSMQFFVFAVLTAVAAFLTLRREFRLTRGRYYSASSPRAPPLAV